MSVTKSGKTPSLRGLQSSRVKQTVTVRKGHSMLDDDKWPGKTEQGKEHLEFSVGRSQGNEMFKIS